MPIRRLFFCAWAGMVFFASLAQAENNEEAAQAPFREVLIKVIDPGDRPVAGARLSLEPLQGSVGHGQEIRSDIQGRIRFAWRLQVTNLAQGTQIRDRLQRYATGFIFRVSKEGFLARQGRVEHSQTTRRVASPELESLNQPANFAPIRRTVVLHRQEDLFGGELSRLDKVRELKKRLAKFHRDISPVARELGVVFGWPAFWLRKGRLTLRFWWLGPSWAGMAMAPLKIRVAMGAGAPLALACGEELLPLARIARLSLDFMRETAPPGEPHGLPRLDTVKIAAPPKAFMDLAKGRISAGSFLSRHPPRLHTGPVREKPPLDET